MFLIEIKVQISTTFYHIENVQIILWLKMYKMINFRF